VTYSIVARDPESGDLGVAVQTDWFAVGTVVTWAEPGVGAVATQSFAEVSYGPLGLDLMRGGKTAPEALRALLAGDSGQALRQVAMVDAGGGVAAHTGTGCVEAAGSCAGDGVTAQANMMERDTVWGAMLDAFADTDERLAERLVAALVAAEGEGGDIRGRQSAALLVVSGDRSKPRWAREVDLRVDEHRDPVAELRRLLRLHRAYERLDHGSDLAESGNFTAAADEHTAARNLAPEDDQIAFWAGLSLAGAGRQQEAKQLLEEARIANLRWPVYLRRLAARGRFPDDPALMDALFPLQPR
jgi:uncharacterized Ntn-hydrolase superfamily protein